MCSCICIQTQKTCINLLKTYIKTTTKTSTLASQPKLNSIQEVKVLCLCMCVCVGVSDHALLLSMRESKWRPLTIVMHCDAVTLAHIAFNYAKTRSSQQQVVLFSVHVFECLSWHLKTLLISYYLLKKKNTCDNVQTNRLR